MRPAILPSLEKSSKAEHLHLLRNLTGLRAAMKGIAPQRRYCDPATPLIRFAVDSKGLRATQWSTLKAANSTKSVDAIDDWRKMLLYFLVWLFPLDLLYLDAFDSVGANLAQRPWSYTPLHYRQPFSFFFTISTEGVRIKCW